jgi:hypothetical protein
MKIKNYTLYGVVGFLLIPLSTLAGPSDYVFTPQVTRGEREIDFKMGTEKSDGTARDSAASLGYGYGVSERWFTEIYAKYKRGDGKATHYDAVEWENKFQLTETGRYPVDVGLILEIERPKEDEEGWEVEWGPLFQSQVGRTQLNANFLFERSYDSAEKSDTELLYQWQAKYLWISSLDFGLQGFGEVGKWNDWESASEQSHRMGPAIFGKQPLGGRKEIEYNAAWLFGFSDAAPDTNFRLQVEYEF